MALINCPECGGKVSSMAQQCIHCGFPLEAQADEYINDICAIDGKELDLHEFREYVISLYETVGYVSDEEKSELIDSLYEDCNHVSREFVARLIQTIIDTKSIPEKHESFGYRKSLEWDAERQKECTARRERAEREKYLIHCPKCNSTNITTGSRGYSMVWGFIGSGKTVNRCGKCGHKWEPKK